MTSDRDFSQNPNFEDPNFEDQQARSLPCHGLLPFQDVMHRAPSRPLLGSAAPKLFPSLFLSLFLTLSLSLLAGCQSGPQIPSLSSRVSSGPISIEAIDGVPAALQAGLRDGLATGAAQNGLSLTDHADRAKFHLHGYLHVERSARQMEASLVFDVFDAEENRLQRLKTDIKRSPSASLTIEAPLTPAEISQLGAASMRDLAAYLTP